MSAPRRRRRHIGEVVALADILANGVAILMMLIVLSIKIQSDQAQEEINQNADITTILSRDMVKSVIYNDLPSSPPAVLHDYSSCMVAHDCNESLYPILEVYDDKVRLKNERVSISMAELLRRPNPVDKWLSAFSPNEKYNIRMDIYGVGAYYLALSILNENGISHPRHWHFLARPRRGGEGDGEGGMSSEDFIAKYEDTRGLGDGDDGLGSAGEEAGEEAGEDGGGEPEEELPFSSGDLGDVTMIEGLSFNELTDRGMLSGKGSPEGEPGGKGESESEIKSRMSEGKFSSIGISLPNMPESTLKVGDGAAQMPLGSRDFMLFVALLLLHYGDELEGFQVPYLSDTLAWLKRRPRHIKRNSNIAYLDEVSVALDAAIDKEGEWPENFTSSAVDEIERVGLRGGSMSFINDFVYQTMSDKPALTVELSLMLRPWPSAYQGERTEITDSVVLAHPLHIKEDSDGPRWLPLAFLTPVGDALNINVGFVLAEVSGGEIFIPSEPNQVWSKSGPMRPLRGDVDVQPSLLRLFYIYSPPALLFLLVAGWWFIRAWRQGQKTGGEAYRI